VPAQPAIPIELPSDHDEEIARRFTVTFHYLLHLQLFLSNTYGRGADMEAGIGAVLSSHRPYLKLQRKPGLVPIETVQRHLEIAWVGEIALRLPASIGSDAAFRYSNAWAPIHAYYATYMLLQAWFDANGMTGLADDHTATLRSISAMIKERDLFPVPWSVLASGNVLGGECVYLNEPSADVCAAGVQVLSIPIGLPGAYSDAEFWARYGTWLRTTREARLEVREDDWKRKNGRRRMDSQKRRQFAASLHPTSLFDCLWRLRIRSNYKSVETYLARFVRDDDARRFHKALVQITRANLFLLECYVARVVGAADYEATVETFLAQDPQGVAAQTVGRRLPAVLATTAAPAVGRR
jgi:hypothetical protein